MARWLEQYSGMGKDGATGEPMICSTINRTWCASNNLSGSIHAQIHLFCPPASRPRRPSTDPHWRHSFDPRRLSPLGPRTQRRQPCPQSGRRVEHASFTQALRIEVLHEAGDPWSVEIGNPTALAVQKGDVAPGSTFGRGGSSRAMRPARSMPLSMLRKPRPIGTNRSTRGSV